jgi:hypothetical protein
MPSRGRYLVAGSNNGFSFYYFRSQRILSSLAGDWQLPTHWLLCSGVQYSNLLLPFASTVILGFGSRRDSSENCHLFLDFYVHWNGASSSTRGGAWLLRPLLSSKRTHFWTHRPTLYDFGTYIRVAAFSGNKWTICRKYSNDSGRPNLNSIRISVNSFRKKHGTWGMLCCQREWP